MSRMKRHRRLNLPPLNISSSTPSIRPTSSARAGAADSRVSCHSTSRASGSGFWRGGVGARMTRPRDGWSMALAEARRVPTNGCDNRPQERGERELIDVADQSLTARAALAARWRFAGQGVGALSQFGVGILLARLLTPADFGLVALALSVFGFAQPFVDMGVGAAVVQRLDLTPRHQRAAFTLAVLLGAATAAVIWIGAPVGALFVHDSAVVPVLRALSFNFALGGAGVVADALLRRRL